MPLFQRSPPIAHTPRPHQPPTDARATTVAQARASLRREARYLKQHQIVPVHVDLPPAPARTVPYNDRRGELASNYYLMRTPMGAMHAAVARHLERGASPVRVLAIGAGEGLAELGLRQRFGDAVHLTQIGPTYSTAPHMAATFDAALPIPADDPYSLAQALATAGTLPPFDLAWSIYGNLHDAGDQLAIVQRVVDRLRVGGEFFLMWDVRPHQEQTRWYYETVRRTSAFFRARGLDLVVTPDHDRNMEAYLWGRKLIDDVPFEAIWDDVAMTHTTQSRTGRTFTNLSICEIMERCSSELGFLERFIGRDGRRYDLRPRIRLSPDTEPLRLQRPELDAVTRLMVADLFDGYGIRAREMAYACYGPRTDSDDEALGHIAAFCLQPPKLADLEAGMPLSTILLRGLSYSVAQLLLNVGFTCPFTLPTTPQFTAAATARSGGPRIFW